MAEHLEGSGRPLLVAGAPRTGTTWTARVLSFAEGVIWLNEPDNEWPHPFALKAKLPLGRFPVLVEGDRAPRRYEQLWERALAGFRHGRYQEALAWRMDQGEKTTQELWRAMCDHAHPRLSPALRLLSWVASPPSSREVGQTIMVKSVHAPLALEWLVARLQPTVLLVLRHPFNVIASWMDLGWGGCALETNPRVRERLGDRWGLPDLDARASQLQRLTWEVGLFTCALESAAEQHPDWLVASHESLCRDPRGGFRRLYGRLGFTWSTSAEAFLDRSNRPGTGYSIDRVASEQPERWRRRLRPEHVREIWSVLSRVQAPWVERLARDVE